MSCVRDKKTYVPNVSRYNKIINCYNKLKIISHTYEKVSPYNEILSHNNEIICRTCEIILNSFEQSKASVKRIDGPRWISATSWQIYRQQFVFCYIMKSNHCLKKESHPPHTYPSIKTTFQNTHCNRTQRCPNEKKTNKKQIRTILMFDITAQAQPRIYSLSIYTNSLDTL